MSRVLTLRTAGLYGPEDLLRNAKHLLDSGDSKVMRAVVLESMAALEVYVHTKVFKILEKKLDSEFIEWLRKETRFNFTKRLGIITPLALDIKISKFKQSDLWRRYKEAREIRNSVSHGGIIISYDEAQVVYKIVYDWLACLGSSIGMELALIELKQYIEENHIPISTEVEGASIVNKYFKESSVANIMPEFSYAGAVAFDYVLRFGTKPVALEMKLLLRVPSDLNQYIMDLITRLSEFLDRFNIDKIAIIIFLKGEVEMSFQQIRKYDTGKILTAVIRVE